MRIEIITIGRIKEPFILGGEAEYLKRLPSWCKVEFVEIPTHDLAKLPRPKYLEQQDIAFQEATKGADRIYILDERGESLTSEKFAELVRAFKDHSTRRICFAIGGPEGWGDTTRNRATRTISLSSLTFPHHFCRLLLIEQLYRATTILGGTPYHK